MHILRTASLVLISAGACVACRPELPASDTSPQAQTTSAEEAKKSSEYVTREELEKHKADTASAVEANSARQRAFEESYELHRAQDRGYAKSIEERIARNEAAGRAAAEVADARFAALEGQVSSNTEGLHGVRAELGEVWTEMERMQELSEQRHNEVLDRIGEAMNRGLIQLDDGTWIDPTVEELRRLQGKRNIN